MIDRFWKKHPHLTKSFGDNHKKRSALMADTMPVSQENEDDNQYICLMGKVTHYCLTGKLENSKILKSSKSWFIDSGCRNHMTFDRSQFSSYVSQPPGVVYMDKKGTAEVTGKGNITVELKVDGRRQMCILKDVLHVPDLGYQLLSVPTMDKLGLEILFTHARCRIKTDTKTISSGTL
jgi:hypothetical protein